MFDLTTYPKKQEIPQLKTVFSTLDTLCQPGWQVGTIKAALFCRKKITLVLAFLDWLIFARYGQILRERDVMVFFQIDPLDHLKATLQISFHKVECEILEE